MNVFFTPAAVPDVMPGPYMSVVLAEETEKKEYFLKVVVKPCLFR